MALSFATDIRPLFREEDIGCMKSMGIDLDDPCLDVRARQRAGCLPDCVRRLDASG